MYDGPEQEEYSSFVIDDPQETYKILKQIVSAVQKLEQQHAQYKREKFRKTKYGSQWVEFQLFPHKVTCLFLVIAITELIQK